MTMGMPPRVYDKRYNNGFMLLRHGFLARWKKIA
jgi:hypothetical protein